MKASKGKKGKASGWYAGEWLAAKGLKQAQIVATTGYSKSLVSDYISGVRRWNVDVLDAFGKAIGIPGRALLWPPEMWHGVMAEILEMDEKGRDRALKILRAMGDEK